jgi:AraC-like DNA-binding protein
MDAMRFNSEDLPSCQRAKAVEQLWSENLLMDIDLPTGLPTFSIDACALPGLSISIFSGSEAKITRSNAQALATEKDLVICVADHSPVKVQRSGRPEHVFAPGEAHIWQSDMATYFEVGSPYQATMLSIPAEDLAKASLDLDRALDEGITRQATELKLLAGYANNFMSCAQGLGEHAALTAARQLRELIILALQPFSTDQERRTASKNKRFLRLERIKDDIRTHLSNPALSPSWLASREGISERYLRYILAEEQTHYSELVLDMRLAKSFEQLADPCFRHQTISTVAFNCGFNDLSYFCRVFKRRYACTPSDIRPHARNS